MSVIYIMAMFDIFDDVYIQNTYLPIVKTQTNHCIKIQKC